MGGPSRALTEEDGPAVIFDGVGGEVGRTAFEIAAPGARFSAHGAPAGTFAPIDPVEAKERQIAIFGIDAVQFTPTEGRRLTAAALSDTAAGRIRPVIGRSYPLEQAARAHRAMEARQAVGKTLLEVRPA